MFNFKKISEIYQRIPAFLRNKYALTLIIFFIWMLLVDQNSIIKQVKLRSELNRHREEKKDYVEKIQEVSEIKQALLNDSSKLEKFAREKYWMKKDDEDLYVVIYEDGEK